MRSPLLTTTVLAVLSALAVTACDTPSAAAQAKTAAPRPAVGTVTTAVTAVPLVVELPGRTTPHLMAELRPQVTGIVQKRLFREGSTVEAGQTLYRIDPASYRAAVDSAQAGLARAEATLASERLKAARYAELVKLEAVSRQANDEAQAALMQAEADVTSARAALAKARIDLGFTRLASPISGRIGRSTVTAGALVTANQAEALATVQQLDPIYVDLTQSSSQMLELRRRIASGEVRRDGDTLPVTLTLEDGSRYAHAGRLAFSEVSVDESTGSVTLRAEFPNPDGLLLPGMFVRAQVTQGQTAAAILLPHAAVAYDARGQAVAMVVGPDGTVEARTLTLAGSRDGQWIVTAGLAAGGQVIVEGLQKVRVGSPVTAEPLQAADPAKLAAR